MDSLVTLMPTQPVGANHANVVVGSGEKIPGSTNLSAQPSARVGQANYLIVDKAAGSAEGAVTVTISHVVPDIDGTGSWTKGATIYTNSFAAEAVSIVAFEPRLAVVPGADVVVRAALPGVFLAQFARSAGATGDLGCAFVAGA